MRRGSIGPVLDPVLVIGSCRISQATTSLPFLLARMDDIALLEPLQKNTLKRKTNNFFFLCKRPNRVSCVTVTQIRHLTLILYDVVASFLPDIDALYLIFYDTDVENRIMANTHIEKWAIDFKSVRYMLAFDLKKPEFARSIFWLQKNL